MSIGAPSHLGLSRFSPAERAAAQFRETFGCSPAAIAFAPGRVNLIGDHTDYCEGLVCPVALAEGCACAIGPRDAELAAVSAELPGNPIVGATRPITLGDLADQPSWFRYVAGTYEMMRSRFAPGAGGVNIAVASDVPPGSGLSSSASLEVSIATALEALWALTVDPVAKALACQAAEHRFAGAPCGIMDQMISVLGQPERALRIDCRDSTTHAVPLPPTDLASFVIFDSGVTHANDDGGYAERRAACETAAPKLGVRSLRDLRLSDLASLHPSLNEAEHDAVRHVVSENARVEAFSSLLPAMRLADAGSLMNESHRSLSETYRVSCPEVDALVRVTQAQPGVDGARMTGGGFGGWIVALVRSAEIDEVVAAVTHAYAAETGIETAHRVVRAGRGARIIR